MLRGHVGSRELGELGEPFRILPRAREEAELNPAEELHLQMVDILDLHPCDIRPGLVGEGVVVQELVGQDQRSGEEAILCTLARVNDLVGFFEVDHQLLDVLEREKDDAGREQGGTEDI